MNILFLSGFLPTQTADSAGVLDAAWFLKALSRDHNVTLLTFYSKGEEVYFDPVRSICEESIFVRDRSFESRLFYLLKSFVSLFSPRSAIVEMAHSRAIKKHIAELLKRRSFDLVVIEFTQMFQYIDLIPHIPIIVDESDIAFVRRRRYALTALRGLLRLLFLHDSRKLQKYEIDRLSCATGILIRTRTDISLLRHDGLVKQDEDFHVLLPWVNFDGADTIPLVPEESSVMFFGAMWRPVNADAAVYFAEEILPLIISVVPEVKFYIIGSRPGKDVRSLASDRIIVTGYVESIVEYYRKCSVVVVPLRSGSGIKGKVIQALGFGRPVVSTAVGAEGIEFGEEEFLFVRDDPKGFAQMVSNLLKNRIAPNDLHDLSRMVQQRFSWEDNIHRAEEFLQRIRARGSSTAY